MNFFLRIKLNSFLLNPRFTFQREGCAECTYTNFPCEECAECTEFVRSVFNGFDSFNLFENMLVYFVIHVEVGERIVYDWIKLIIIRTVLWTQECLTIVNCTKFFTIVNG